MDSRHHIEPDKVQFLVEIGVGKPAANTHPGIDGGSVDGTAQCPDAVAEGLDVVALCQVVPSSNDFDAKVVKLVGGAIDGLAGRYDQQIVAVFGELDRQFI